MAKNWHIYDVQTLAKELNTNLSDGLSPREAAVRLEKNRKNTKGKKWSLFVSPSKNSPRSYLQLLANPFALTMFAMSSLALCFGRTVLGLSALTVLISAAVISGLITYSANKTLEDMKDYASPMVKVKRGGNVYYIDGRNLVCGDLIIVSKGDLLPCDAAIVRCDGLSVDEFYRDGEKLLRRSARKSSDVNYDENTSVKSPDAENILYAGSVVCEGSALCLVLEVGSNTYLGEFSEAGALGDKDGEPLGVKNLFFEIQRFSLLALAILAVLSLVAIVTLGKKADLFFIFTTFLSAFFFISVNLPTFGSRAIFSSYISRAKRRKSSKKKRIDRSFVRNIKSLDTLSGITDLVLLGASGISQGELKASEVYIPTVGLTAFDDVDKQGSIHSLLYTYVKAKNEKNRELSDRTDHLTDAVRACLIKCGFDMSGSDMTLQSLSYSRDVKAGICFAYAETNTRFYRVGLVNGRSALDMCEYIRFGDELKTIDAEDIKNINEAYSNFDAQNRVAVTLISESEEKTVFEAVISFERLADSEFSAAAGKLESFGVKTTILLDNECNNSLYLLNDEAISAYIGEDIAYAKDFRANSLDILHGLGRYKAYVGFDKEEYVILLREMKKRGAVTAAMGVSDSYNEIMAAANLGITFDVVAYSGNKFREFVYEYLPAEGNDDCVRASQRTRLLSKVIVPRADERSGGISSVFRALRLSRAAHISFAHSLLLFVILMASLISFTVMSPLTGHVLLDPLQTVSLSAVIAIMSFTVFSDTEPSLKMLSPKKDLKIYTISLIKEFMPDIIGSAITAASVSLTAAVIALCGVFGDTPCFTLPVYTCMIFTLVLRVFTVRSRLVSFRDGKGRINSKLLISIGCLVFVGVIALIPPFSGEFYKNGIGLYELLILPSYALIYLISMGIAKRIRRSKR